MENVKTEVFEEAVSRITELIGIYNLNPNILKYFKEGRVYYSYLTAGGIIGSIDTVSYDKRYEEAVKEFERKFEGCLVYHAIETYTEYGEMLSLLYVGNNKENWEMERVSENYIATYTINFTYPDLSEFGDIVVSGYGNSGALIRVG